MNDPAPAAWPPPGSQPIPDTPYSRRMAAGHRIRTGHDLDAELVPTAEPGIWRTQRACCPDGEPPMTPDGLRTGGTLSVYLMGDAGPQRWTLGEPVQCEPGCGCWECITQ